MEDVARLLLRHGWIHGNERDEKTFTVTDEQVVWLVKTGHIVLPDSWPEAIRDESQADSLMEAIAAMQAIWFVAQCADLRA